MKRPAPYNERLPKGKADADPAMAIDPSDRTGDRNIRAEPLPRRNIEALAKGGKITKVAGKPVGKEDGLIAAQKGEFVIKRASVRKYGDTKMAAVNRGTAKVTAPRKR